MSESQLRESFSNCAPLIYPAGRARTRDESFDLLGKELNAQYTRMIAIVLAAVYGVTENVVTLIPAVDDFEIEFRVAKPASKKQLLDLRIKTDLVFMDLEKLGVASKEVGYDPEQSLIVYDPTYLYKLMKTISDKQLPDNNDLKRHLFIVSHMIHRLAILQQPDPGLHVH